MAPISHGQNQPIPWPTNLPMWNPDMLESLLKMHVATSDKRHLLRTYSNVFDSRDLQRVFLKNGFDASMSRFISSKIIDFSVQARILKLQGSIPELTAPEKRLFRFRDERHWEALYLNIDSATGVEPTRLDGLSNPYVSIRLGDQHARTRVIFNATNPTWNESFAIVYSPGTFTSQNPLKLTLFSQSSTIDKKIGEVSIVPADLVGQITAHGMHLHNAPLLKRGIGLNKGLFHFRCAIPTPATLENDAFFAVHWNEGFVEPTDFHLNAVVERPIEIAGGVVNFPMRKMKQDALHMLRGSMHFFKDFGADAVELENPDELEELLFEMGKEGEDPPPRTDDPDAPANTEHKDLPLERLHSQYMKAVWDSFDEVYAIILRHEHGELGRGKDKLVHCDPNLVFHLIASGHDSKGTCINVLQWAAFAPLASLLSSSMSAFTIFECLSVAAIGDAEYARNMALSRITPLYKDQFIAYTSQIRASQEQFHQQYTEVEKLYPMMKAKFEVGETVLAVFKNVKGKRQNQQEVLGIKRTTQDRAHLVVSSHAVYFCKNKLLGETLIHRESLEQAIFAQTSNSSMGYGLSIQFADDPKPVDARKQEYDEAMLKEAISNESLLMKNLQKLEDDQSFMVPDVKRNVAYRFHGGERVRDHALLLIRLIIAFKLFVREYIQKPILEQSTPVAKYQKNSDKNKSTTGENTSTHPSWSDKDREKVASRASVDAISLLVEEARTIAILSKLRSKDPAPQYWTNLVNQVPLGFEASHRQWTCSTLLHLVSCAMNSKPELQRPSRFALYYTAVTQFMQYAALSFGMDKLPRYLLEPLDNVKFASVLPSQQVAPQKQYLERLSAGKLSIPWSAKELTKCTVLVYDEVYANSLRAMQQDTRESLGRLNSLGQNVKLMKQIFLPVVDFKDLLHAWYDYLVKWEDPKLTIVIGMFLLVLIYFRFTTYIAPSLWALFTAWLFQMKKLHNNGKLKRLYYPPVQKRSVIEKYKGMKEKYSKVKGKAQDVNAILLKIRGLLCWESGVTMELFVFLVVWTAVLFVTPMYVFELAVWVFVFTKRFRSGRFSRWVKRSLHERWERVVPSPLWTKEKGV